MSQKPKTEKQKKQYRKPIQLFSPRGNKKLPPLTYKAFHLVVVANTNQKKRFEQHKIYQHAQDVIILSATDILVHGCFGYEISKVDWKPGWALECERPEEVVKRVTQRMAVAST